MILLDTWWQRVVQRRYMLTSTHPAVKAAKPEDFIDNSLVEEIQREGFLKQFEP